MTFKTRLTELLHYMRDEQIAFADRLTEEERAEVGAPDNWSAKDNVIHSMVWANRALDNLETIESGQETSDHAGGDNIDFTKANDEIFQEHKEDTWEEAQALVRSTYDRADTYIGRTSEETLLSVPNEGERPIWRRITANFITHPMIHLWENLRQRGQDDLVSELFGEPFANRLAGLQDDDTWRGTTYYNLACTYALTGHKKTAIARLGEALSLAPELVEWSQQDSDLDSLRDDPAFQALYE